MNENFINSLNQISYVSQFVDEDVETVVREFHQQCFSTSGSVLDSLISVPSLGVNHLLRVEGVETRFSHITDIIEASNRTEIEKVKRWRSLTKAKSENIDFSIIAYSVAEALAADNEGRRPYPSGGALYSAEALIICGNKVKNVKPFSVLHFLPVSNRYEICPSFYDQDKYNSISCLNDVLYYVCYFLNIKKTIFKYRSRGYRLGLLEVGSMYQSLIESSQRYGISSRVLSGFSEYALTKNCGLDSRLMLPVIIQAFGIE